MTHKLSDRLQQTATCRLVRGVFVSTVGLVLLFPIYDLLTGDISMRIWRMLLVSLSLLVYLYVFVCMVGRWSEYKQRMLLPSRYVPWVVLLIVSCGVAFYHDFVLGITSWIPYLFVLAVAVMMGMVAVISSIREHLHINKLTKLLHL